MTALSILLLEDKELDAELTLAELERGGWDLRVRRVDTREAFTRAVSENTCFDLILADYALPDFDGVSALRIAREKCPHVPFIFVSGVIGEEVAIDGLLQGATDYVLKNRLRRLVPAVQRALAEVQERRARARTQEDLQETESRYRALLETLHDYAIVFTDMQGTIVSWNKGAERIFGYAEPEIMGRPTETFFPAEDREAAARELHAARTHGRAGDDRWLERKDGSRFWASGVLLALHAKENRTVGFAKIVRDMTTQKRAQEAVETLNVELEQRVVQRTAELVKSQRALQQAQNLEAIGRLAGGVAHDFNNLMTGILGITEDLYQEIGDEAHRRELHEVIKAARKAAGLTRQLLAFGRRQNTAPSAMNFNQVVEEAQSLFQRIMGAHVRMVMRFEPALGLVRADEGQLEQVLINLALNARDAMPEGGDLVFETANVSLNAGDAVRRQLDLPAGDYVRLSVVDSGCGMSDDTLERIFEPFFTTKGVGKGTGLGLATVYGIVKQNQGAIGVSSRVGEGTRFDVYWPRLLAEALPVTPALDRSRIPGGSETVLVVEDEPIVRQVATRALRKRGYQVLEAANGSEALQIAATHRNGIDLLLTDVVMPGLNGRQVAQQLQSTCPGIAVLYMSGHDEDIVSKQGVLEPGIAFISKTFSPGSLCQKVRDVLDQHHQLVANPRPAAS